MSDMEQSGVKKKKKRLRKGRVFLLLILLIGILCGGFMAGMGLYDRFFSADDPVPKQKENQLLTEEPLSSRINVLLLGKDDGDSEDMNNPDAPKRTDSMMVVSFDPEKKQIAIVGLPRDTRVTIPGRRGHDKINAAYAYGGTKRAVRTVEQLPRFPSTTTWSLIGRASLKSSICWAVWTYTLITTWIMKILTPTSRSTSKKATSTWMVKRQVSMSASVTMNWAILAVWSVSRNL